MDLWDCCYTGTAKVLFLAFYWPRTVLTWQVWPCIKSLPYQVAFCLRKWRCLSSLSKKSLFAEPVAEAVDRRVNSVSFLARESFLGHVSFRRQLFSQYRQLVIRDELSKSNSDEEAVMADSDGGWTPDKGNIFGKILLPTLGVEYISSERFCSNVLKADYTNGVISLINDG